MEENADRTTSATLALPNKGRKIHWDKVRMAIVLPLKSVFSGYASRAQVDSFFAF